MKTNTETENANTALTDFIESLGLEYKADFIPWHNSRNSHEKNPSINWTITLSKGKNYLTTDYMQGAGHIPNYNHRFSSLVVYHNAVVDACNTGISEITSHKNGYDAAQAGKTFARKIKLPAPKLADILYSLVLDSDAIEYTFEEWASNYGYDTDSIEAEKMYRNCIDSAIRLRGLIGPQSIGKLRELFQGY